MFNEVRPAVRNAHKTEDRQQVLYTVIVPHLAFRSDRIGSARDDLLRGRQIPIGPWGEKSPELADPSASLLPALADLREVAPQYRHRRRSGGTARPCRVED